MERLTSPKVILAIGFGLIFVVSLTVGPVPDLYPDQYGQYDAVRYEASHDQVIVTHVLTDREWDHLVSTPTPERLERVARDGSGLSAPEREAIDEGRARTTDDVTTGTMYEVDGGYYALIETGSWSKFGDGGYRCSAWAVADNAFCDDMPPPIRLGALLFGVYGYLAGGFLVVRGVRGGPPFEWEYLETNVVAFAGVGAGLGFVIGARSDSKGVLVLGIGLAIVGSIVGMVYWYRQHSRV